MEKFNFDFDGIVDHVLSKNDKLIGDALSQSVSNAKAENGGDLTAILGYLSAEIIRISSDISVLMLKKYHEELISYLAANYEQKHD